MAYLLVCLIGVFVFGPLMAIKDVWPIFRERSRSLPTLLAWILVSLFYYTTLISVVIEASPSHPVSHASMIFFFLTAVSGAIGLYLDRRGELR